MEPISAGLKWPRRRRRRTSSASGEINQSAPLERRRAKSGPSARAGAQTRIDAHCSWANPSLSGVRFCIGAEQQREKTTTLRCRLSCARVARAHRRVFGRAGACQRPGGPADGPMIIIIVLALAERSCLALARPTHCLLFLSLVLSFAVLLRLCRPLLLLLLLVVVLFSCWLACKGVRVRAKVASGGAIGNWLQLFACS